MKRLSLLLALLAFAPAARADHDTDGATPPAQLTRASYLAWLRGANSNMSAFANYVFDWYELQQRQPFPRQVATDPEKMFVSVEKALAETIQLEGDGDIEEGNTIGFDAYMIVDVPIEVALETKLFNWGKPVGARAGDTYPFDTVFSSVHNHLEEKWGLGNYFVSTEQTGGGIVSSLRDDYTVLVRGNPRDGYVLFNAFFAPNGNTATQSHLSVVMMKPTADGKTEYRQCVRQNGQSYKIFGLEYGRKNFGFNVARDRQGEKALGNTMLELKNTGKIRENKPGREELFY